MRDGNLPPGTTDGDIDRAANGTCPDCGAILDNGECPDCGWPGDDVILEDEPDETQ